MGRHIAEFARLAGGTAQWGATRRLTALVRFIDSRRAELSVQLAGGYHGPSEPKSQCVLTGDFELADYA
jgi:hypothetical protein